MIDRSQVVEAIAQALWNKDVAGLETWREVMLPQAEAALDAALDVLRRLDQQEKYSTPSIRLFLAELARR